MINNNTDINPSFQQRLQISESSVRPIGHRQQNLMSYFFSRLIRENNNFKQAEKFVLDRCVHLVAEPDKTHFSVSHL